MWLLIITLNALDAFGTLLILSAGGTEINPLMAYLIDWHPAAFVILKLTAGLYFGLLLAATPNPRPWVVWATAATCLLYGLVVVNHFTLLITNWGVPW